MVREISIISFDRRGAFRITSTAKKSWHASMIFKCARHEVVDLGEQSETGEYHHICRLAASRIPHLDNNERDNHRAPFLRVLVAVARSIS